MQFERMSLTSRVLSFSTLVYDLEYTYDQLGNRLRKIDHVNSRSTAYWYDTDWDLAAEAWVADPARGTPPPNAGPTHSGSR